MEHVVCKHEKETGIFCGQCGAPLGVAQNAEEQEALERSVTRIVEQRFGLTPKSDKAKEPKAERPTLHEKIFGPPRKPNSPDKADREEL